MKKIFFLVLISNLICSKTLAQQNDQHYSESVYSYLSTSLIGVELGLFQAWLSYEQRYFPEVTVKYEIGIDYGFINDGKWYYYAVPNISLQPRMYYNIYKRIERNKTLKNNSANYVSLFIRYHPDIQIISNKYEGNIYSDFSIIPMWGFRRSMSDKISFELGVGIGAKWEFQGNSELGLDANLSLRFGYYFN